MESSSGFEPTNGRTHYPGMDYARTNIDHLRGRRSIKQVGDESGVGQSWLQRYLTATGIRSRFSRRGEATVRRIADKLIPFGIA